jgi:hypothetical protein
MRLELATISGYDASTHTATITLLQGPTASLADVPCAEQCAPADLTAGTPCLVLITDDSQAILLATY